MQLVTQSIIERQSSIEGIATKCPNVVFTHLANLPLLNSLDSPVNTAPLRAV